MKQKAALLVIGLVVSNGCLAGESDTVHLICPMKNHAGESSMTIELSLNEVAGTVKLLPKGRDDPATFSTGVVTWTYPGTPFEFSLERFTGELTMFGTHPERGRLLIHSGICFNAATKKRKF